MGIDPCSWWQVFPAVQRAPWTTLGIAVVRFRARVDERRLKWLNRLAGLAMAGFGVGLILLSRAAK